jgi:pimeloyl-ACP methyl ester carboxylesterase
MLSHLSDFSISWVDAIGMDPRYPPTEGWPHLIEQWIDSIKEPPVYGVGHSLGGYLNYLAAVRRPDLFKAIVLLDAPIIGAFRGSMLGATKRLGIVDRVTPAGATRDRRSHWASREEAKAHFRSRRLFRHFTDQCLDDYVTHGLVRNHELHLKIDPAIEYQIYRTIPHDMMRHLPKLRVPAAFIGGADSDVVRRIRLAGMKPKFVFRKVPGGHLFPFEHPREAATSIARALEDLAAAARAA